MSELTEQQLNEKIRELKELKRHRLLNEPHRYYVPIGKFEDFINLFSSGDYLELLFEAANGVGKTTGIANLLANLFWPTDNPFFQGKLFREWPYSKKGRICSDPNTVTETIIPALKAVFPKGRYVAEEKFSTSKDGKRYESHWSTNTGWEFTIMTYEQDPKEFESATLGWFYEDEPPPILIHKANHSRLRMGGVGIITETPLSGSQWLFEDFIELKPEDKLKQKKAVVTAQVEDACFEHGERGFLSHEQIEVIIAGYDSDELMARAFGKHAHLSGRVFKKWSQDIHVIKPFQLMDREWLVVHALDPHTAVSDAGLWVAFGRDGRIIVVDELWGEWETEELATRIKGINKGYRMSNTQLIDPSAFNVDKHTGESLAGNLNNNGVFYERGSKERSNAIRMIRDVLDYQYINGLWHKKPKLYAFDTCQRFIWEMGHWQYEDWQKRSAAKSLKEKPIDKDDHMIENLGRVLLSGIHYEPQREDNNEYSGKTLNLDPYSKS